MVPRPALGYTMVATAAALFAVNGTVSKVILGSGINAQQLTEVWCAGALIGLTLIAVAVQPSSLRLRRRELPLLVALGVGGLALVQWSYFFAIHRVAIGVALALALTGLVLIVEIWKAHRPNGAGLVAAALAAVTYAGYILLAERGVRARDPISLSAWGFLFATLFWSVLAPWWTFPGARAGDRVSLLGNLASSHLPVWALMVWMVVLGTIVPFALVVAALRHISATRAGITGMLEPVLAIVLAWLWLGESLTPLQLSGATVTLAGISLAQTSR